MIGYVTLGTNDLARASAFYDGLLGELNAARIMADHSYVVWATGPRQPTLMVTKPSDGKDATTGNDMMVALAAGSEDRVDALHAAAMKLGGSDEGAPGPRGDNFYAAYFRDLDGNKLCAFHMEEM